MSVIMRYAAGRCSLLLWTNYVARRADENARDAHAANTAINMY